VSLVTLRARFNRSGFGVPAPLPLLVWLGVDVGVGLCLSSYMLAVIPVVAMLNGR